MFNSQISIASIPFCRAIIDNNLVTKLNSFLSLWIFNNPLKNIWLNIHDRWFFIQSNSLVKSF